MPLWGGNAGNPSKPKNLSLEQQTRVYADNKGWRIIRPGHRDAAAGRHGFGEVLVANRGLQDAIGSSNITAAYFVSPSYSTGATAKVRIHWDMLVTPTTTGTLALTTQAFYIGTQSIAINQGTGTITSLPGVSSVNGATIPSSGTLAINPTTTIGDIIYASATATPGTLSRLAGNTATQTAFLASTGNGTANTTTSFIPLILL